MRGTRGVYWAKAGLMLLLGMASQVGALSGGRASLTESRPTAPCAHRDELIRSIEDPSNGNRWLLVRDVCYPQGPNQLILASENEMKNDKEGKDHPLRQSRPLIRGGDLVWVEEHTATMDANLEATAIESATLGGKLLLRLRIGHRIIRAIASESHRAVFLEDVEQ